MYYRLFILFILIISLSRCSWNKKVSDKNKPNILFIMGDDHTAQAIRCYKGLFADYTKTLNIDRLASEGIMSNNAFCTNTIFSPARATLLTGKYSHKNGVRCLEQTEFPYTTLEWEMFDLILDPYEMKNIYNQINHIELRDALKEKLLELQDKFDDRGFEYPDLQKVINEYW